MNIVVFGGGSFGCALAEHLNSNGNNVKIFVRDSELGLNFLKYRKLPKALGDKELSKEIDITIDMEYAMEGSELILLAVPSTAIRELSKKIALFYNDQYIISVAKGLENESFKTIDVIIEEEINTDKIAVLSGPTHAEEVVRRLPGSCVIASKKIDIATKLQNIFKSDNFRVYTSTDIIGVELCGAIKNIIALAAGISDGLGYGDNAKAALITRGIVEVSRFCKFFGCENTTINGLAGLGDLIVTCSSKHSRNRMCGYFIGQGIKPEYAVSKVGMVVEGINTLFPIYEISKNNGIQTPIIDMIYDVVKSNIPVTDAASILINRELKRED